MGLELRDPANIGGRIQHIRELREMSVSDLAMAIGIKQPSVSDIESGKSKSPSAINLLKICEVLRANPWWVMTGEGTPEQAPDIEGEESEWIAVLRALDSPGKRRAILAAAKAMAEEEGPEDVG